jgi:hypothetical protein
VSLNIDMSLNVPYRPLSTIYGPLSRAGWALFSFRATNLNLGDHPLASRNILQTFTKIVCQRLTPFIFAPGSK